MPPGPHHVHDHRSVVQGAGVVMAQDLHAANSTRGHLLVQEWAGVAAMAQKLHAARNSRSRRVRDAETLPQERLADAHSRPQEVPIIADHLNGVQEYNDDLVREEPQQYNTPQEHEGDRQAQSFFWNLLGFLGLRGQELDDPLLLERGLPPSAERELPMPIVRKHQSERTSSNLYQPLPNAMSCRILQILPGEEEDDVVCDMKPIDLSQGCHTYEALSYVWGSKETPAEIVCNGRLISVTQNLKDGLQRIRFRHRTRAVWVDAICINQSDVVERGKQVKLMRLIYQNAANVLVWLGYLHSEYAENAFSTLRNIHRHGWVFKQRNTQGRPDDLSYPQTDWEALRKFYQLEYFQRIWVIQEVASASSADLMWGRKRIPWRIAGRATYFIRNTEAAFLKLYDDQTAGINNSYIMYRIQHSEFQPITFFDLLRLTGQFQATDERDKIFAILGLPNSDTDPNTGVLFIDPDYTLLRNEVYRQVALKIFETSSMPFDLLSAVDHEGCICEDFPSWIPQWHISYTLDLVPHRPEARYSASGGSWAKGMGSVRRPWIVDFYLFSFGFQYDVITHSTEILHSRGNYDAWYRKTVCSWLENLPLSPNGERCSWQKVAWTLLTGRDWYGVPISSLEALWDAEGPKGSALTAAWAYCRNRKVFRTASGSLGLGPAALATGDVVCVLLGATVPFVLRPELEVYRLAGACYVQEVMTGELVDEWRQSKRIANFFQIR